MSAQSKSVDLQGENEALQGLPKPKHIIDGVPFTLRAGDEYMKVVERIRNLEYRPTDVLLSGYPRTGTTWTLAILWLILHDADVETFKSTIPNERVCRMEYIHAGEESNMSRLDRDVYSDPRVLMTHLPYEFLAPGFKKAGIKVVYTMRNPKDILVSMYHASKSFFKVQIGDLAGGEDPSFETVMKYALSPIADKGAMFKQLKSWWQAKDDPQIYFSFYEDKIRNPRGAVRDLATFLEKDLSEAQIDAILEATGISSMKSTYQNYKQEGRQQHFNVTGGIRKGEIGGWKNQFTVAQSEWLDAQIEKHLGGLDLSFQYE